MMLWISSKESLDTVALHIMFRLRLRVANLCRNELKLLSVEVEHLASLITAFYSSINVPDVLAAVRADWFSNLFHESRHYNPLTWSLALAFCGETDPFSLDGEYVESQTRRPQPDFFEIALAHQKKRRRAPLHLYAAFDGALFKAEAIDRSGLSKSEVDGWLRKDKELAVYWKTTWHARKRRDAIATISSFLRKYPESMRVNVLRSCNQAYRWLEQNDPKALGSVVPPVQEQYDAQMRFQF